MTSQAVSLLTLTGSTGLTVGILALAMVRHFERVFNLQPSPLQVGLLRLMGWFGLAMTFTISLATWNGGSALVTWFALLAAQSFAITLILAYVPTHFLWWLGVHATLVLLGLFRS